MTNTEGICSDCREWTDARDSCCGASVWVDGGMVHPEWFDENGNKIEQKEKTK